MNEVHYGGMVLRKRPAALTARERAVLVRMMDGMSASEIATAEFMGLATARTHIRNILTKLGVNTQLAAVTLIYAACWPTDDQRREALTQALAGAA